MDRGTSFEMGLIIPGFLEKFEMEDLVKAILPRELMVVSADGDKYSKDADLLLKPHETVQHFRFSGGHALDQQRHDLIVDWVATR